MRKMVRLSLVTMIVGAFVIMPSAQAFHWYRGATDNCTPADGELTDDPTDPTTEEPIHGPLGATVEVWHDSYHDPKGLEYLNAVAETTTGTDVVAGGIPVTRINAGDSVEWTWNSAHCHSVTSEGFRSCPTSEVPVPPAPPCDLHYPQTAPQTPQAVDGFFEYPVLETNPTLSYRHTFETPGTYLYSCRHHAIIGMRGVVIVE